MRNLQEAMKEAGVAVNEDGELYKTENNRLNLGVYPELALAKALVGKEIAKRLQRP